MKILNILVLLIFMSSNAHSLDAKGVPVKPDGVMQLANELVLSHQLFEEGTTLYKNKNYSDAKIKFKKALIKDPRNKKAEKYLTLCDKMLLKEEKIRQRDKARRKSGMESKAWGIFGVNKKGLTELLSNISAKNLPKKPMILDDCIKTALENSIEMDIATKQVNLAKSRLLEARRKMTPTVRAKLEMYSGIIYGEDYEGRRINVEGTQPLFHGGELIFTAKQADVNLQIVEKDLDRIKNDVVLKVEKAYFSLDKALKYIKVQEKLHRDAKELNGFIAKGYQSGAVSRLEYLNVASKYNQIHFQFVSSEEDASLAKLILQQAMNTEEDVDIEPVKDPVTNDKISLEACYFTAYANRPEMIINSLMTEYYLYEKKIAGSRSWPRVDLMGMMGQGGENFTADGLQIGPEWYAGIKVNMPFFGNTAGYSFTRESWQPVVASVHGTDTWTHTVTLGLLDDLRLYSEMTEADIGFERAQQEYNKVKQDITLEVKETFFKYKKALLQMGVAKSKVEYQSRNVEFMQAKREMDEALVSDVLEQIIKLGEEEFSQLQSMADYHISIKSLNKAVGIIGYFDTQKED